jgi:cardiolipin synthase
MAADAAITYYITNMEYKFYTSTLSSWDAMLESCQQAEQSIYIEEYALEPDQIGNRFIDLLIEKAQQGLKVRLMLDWWGCRPLTRSKRFKEMCDAGIKIRLFREPSWQWIYRRPRFFPRDHRKIMVIDEKISFIGGVCIYDAITQWRDTMVKIYDQGITNQLLCVFKSMWAKVEGDETAVTAHPTFETNHAFSIYANAPESGEYMISDWLVSQIRCATRCIKLTTPYFVPSKRVMEALVEALDRGVDVEILLSRPVRFPVYVLGKHMCGKLIRHGAKVFYYNPGMIHVKMMSFDDEIGAIGSCNMDGLSIQQNEEVMLIAKDRAFVKEMLANYANDRAQSDRYELVDWNNRPFHQALVGYLCLPFKRYL